MNIPDVPKPRDPKFLDKPIGQLQDILKKELLWLNHSFGKAQRLAEIKESKKRFFPAIYIADLGRYINLFPDQELGNYSFVYAEDGNSIFNIPKQHSRIEATISIIFWFNLDSIFQSEVDRNLENVKDEILKTLTRRAFITSGRLEVTDVFETYENVYKEFDLDNFRGESLAEIHSQMLMHPYAALRFKGKISFLESC